MTPDARETLSDCGKESWGLAEMKSFKHVVLLALVLWPSVAFAQFSESYNFLKAVRDKDGNKATEIISKPGSVIIDTKDNSTGDAAVHIVTKRRDLTWLNFLLSKGAKADARDRAGNTPMLLATQIGFGDAVNLLIARRAQVDLPNNAGETPLIIAVQRRDITLVRALLLAGANPKKIDRSAGLSARDYAARDNRATAILKLIDETKTAKAAVAGPKL
jgi:ankyrin repeat protein